MGRKKETPKPQVTDEALVNAYTFRIREAVESVWMHCGHLPDGDKQEILARVKAHLDTL